jgi:hypothetical protein
MGFANRIGTRFLSQGIASLGGFFTALCLQFPPPPDSPELPPPSVMQEFVTLLLALMLLFALVLLILPEKWSRRVLHIAFCMGPKK